MTSTCLFTFMAMLCIVYAVDECTFEETEAYNKCAAEYTTVEYAEDAIGNYSTHYLHTSCEGLRKSAVCYPPCFCDTLADSMSWALLTAGCEGSNINCGSAATLLASPLLLMLSGLIGAGILGAGIL